MDILNRDQGDALGKLGELGDRIKKKKKLLIHFVFTENRSKIYNECIILDCTVIDHNKSQNIGSQLGKIL